MAVCCGLVIKCVCVGGVSGFVPHASVAVVYILCACVVTCRWLPHFSEPFNRSFFECFLIACCDVDWT